VDSRIAGAHSQKEDHLRSPHATLTAPFALSGIHHSMTHLLLEGTQRKERGFLGWGESLRPADIEPFVGSVALQRPHQLSTLQVPHLESTILTTTGEQPTIRA